MLRRGPRSPTTSLRTQEGSAQMLGQQSWVGTITSYTPIHQPPANPMEGTCSSASSCISQYLPQLFIAIIISLLQLLRCLFRDKVEREPLLSLLVHSHQRIVVEIVSPLRLMGLVIEDEVEIISHNYYQESRLGLQLLIKDMGIPSFYAWLKKRYPLIKLKLEDQGREVPIIDNMFIDFNALIYRCIREEHHFLVNQLDPRSLEEIHERVIEYMDELIDTVNPQKLLFIGLDGVVPRAKINQSRERRFKASKEKEKVEEFHKLLGIKDIENFKVNSISPGTEFLYTLCNKIKGHILAKMDNDWRHLSVIYSDCCTPGEGEQKILEFIRVGRDKGLFGENSTHCIYSPDADLFLLSLSTRLKNIYIIREEYVWSRSKTQAHLRKEGVNSFEIVFVNILREYFQLEFQEVKETIKNFDIYRVIDDFILIMMFVGNDFLPKSFSYNIKEGHLTELLNRYKDYLKERDDYLNDKGKINWGNTEQLLKIASEFEVKLIQEKLAKKIAKDKDPKIKDKEREGNESDSDDENFVKEFLVEDNRLTKGRTYYYQSRFKFDPDAPENAKKLEAIILKYLEGLEFYVTYYYLGCQSWSWYYPYHYTPLLVDVYEYINNKRVKQVKLKEKGQPLDPVMALMLMVPQHSFGLLPQPVREAILDKESKLRTPIDYYPLKFDMDPFVPPSDFEQKALIPFLEESIVKQVYTSIPREKYSKEEIQRNTKKNNTIFRRVGEGKVERTSGAEFNISREGDVNELSLSFPKPSTEKRRRFPTLKRYGNDATISKTMISIHVNRRHVPAKDELIQFNNFQGIVEDVDKVDGKTADLIESEYAKIGLLGQCQNVARVKLVRLVRSQTGYKLVRTLREVLVPDFAIFKTPEYDYLRKSKEVDQLKRFLPFDRVMILNRANFGDIGVIEGVEGDKYTLRILERSQVLTEKIEQNQQAFYTLRYACEDLQLPKEVLYAIMDEVIVKTNPKQQYGSILPQQWNLGLSLIDRKKGLLVPKYVRCQHQHQNPNNSYAIFDYMEISESGLQLIKTYIKQLPEVIAAVKTDISKNAGKLKIPLPFDKIVKGGQNIDIARLYLKLFRIEAKGRQYRIYSKISVQVPKWGAQEKNYELLKIHPRYLLSKAEARVSPLPYLSRQPQYHMVGDRVIATKDHQTGVVTGIDDFNMVVRVPRKLRSYRYPFTHLMNQKWADTLEKQEGAPWNLEHSYYSPSYWTKAIDFLQE